MPFYEYIASGEPHCPLCGEGFDRLQKLDDDDLSVCPDCGAEVVRKISAPNLASSSPSLQSDNIEKHGFTQYKKLDKGVYEKTAGKGPDIITDD
jgi:putative FmdB family regulatory protein